MPIWANVLIVTYYLSVALSLSRFMWYIQMTEDPKDPGPRAGMFFICLFWPIWLPIFVAYCSMHDFVGGEKKD